MEERTIIYQPLVISETVTSEETYIIEEPYYEFKFVETYEDKSLTDDQLREKYRIKAIQKLIAEKIKQGY